jgi:HD-GYP domain-containing protein (c-di-GMP phosphodiesterase class II)
MDKKKQMNFNLNNFLLSISFLLDCVDNEEESTSVNHSKRVAYLSLNIGIKLNLSPALMFDLCAYCLCHNLTLYPKGTENCNEQIYLETLNEKMKYFPFQSEEINVLKYQNERYDGSGTFNIKSEDTSILSQILSFSHLIDQKFDLSNRDIQNRIDISTFLDESSGSLLNPKFVNIYKELNSKASFYLDLQNEYEILYFIYANLHDFTIAMDLEKVLKLTSTIFKVVDTNSLLIENCQIACNYYNFDHKDKYTFLIAASLCNIGKLSISSEILNKASNFTENEYELIKAYPYYTNKALTNIMGFNDIAKCSSKVQENISSKGYPFGLTAKDLSFKDLLLSSLLIYSSLTQDKAYRKAFTHNEAINIMNDLVNEKILDKGIITDMGKVFIL